MTRITNKSHIGKSVEPQQVAQFFYFSDPDAPLLEGESVVDHERTLIAQRNEFAGMLWAVENWPQWIAMCMASNQDHSWMVQRKWIQELAEHGPTEKRTQLRKRFVPVIKEG